LVLSNIIASQDVHKAYGGVVPELASRAHQQNIIPVVDTAIKKAEINKEDINAIAFTRGPGLMGSLLVGTSFAKGLAISLNVPLIEVNHLQAHILVPFIKEPNVKKEDILFPFLCLLVSGGHTQIVLVKDYLQMEIIGNTIDDAAGEAFDKCAKILSFPYPGGPMIDKLAKDGKADKFNFSRPNISGFDYSFSGLKTSFLYFVRDQLKEDETFIEKNINDLCASIQHTIIEILMDKLIKATEKTGIRQVAIAGGVSANSGLREKIIFESKKRNWKIFIPEFRFTTDNAAMIAITGYFKYKSKIFANQSISPLARLPY
jgi:N6-L-threonylcarbamoyladenine synthase